MTALEGRDVAVETPARPEAPEISQPLPSILDFARAGVPVGLDSHDELELEGTKALAKIRPTQECGYLIRELLKIPRRRS